MTTAAAHDAAPDHERPRALVVVESMFGNTQQVGAAVALGLDLAGFEVEVLGVTTAPAELPANLALLVVGAPTHAFSLSRPSTREDAVRQGADAERAGYGMREWLGECHDGEHPPPVAVFDTRVSKVRRLPMAAGPAARRLARAKGFEVLDHPAYFLVEDISGPLAAGELARATGWGRHIGALCLERGAVVAI
ncbi:flavodoxin family protein [Nocardioides dilutus]